MEYELLKFRGWRCDERTPTLKFIHFHNRLMKDNRENTLDPYPAKDMRNLQSLVDALGKFLKSLARVFSRG